MKNKKYFIFNAVFTTIFFVVLSVNHEKLDFFSWMLIAIIVEIFVQILGQIIFKRNKNNDDSDDN